MNKSIPLLMAGILAATVSLAQQTITGLVTPESVVAWKDGYFVSQIGPKLDAAAKDGDGSIAFVKAGKVQSLRYFNDTLNAPKGLVIIGHILYVTDIDHLKGYDINSRKKVFDLNLEGKAGVLNDITTAHDSLLVVTDSFKGDVLLADPRSGAIRQLGNLATANGVAYDESTDELYVCTMGPDMNGKGQLYHRRLDVINDTFQPVKNSPSGLFDGLVQLDATHLLLSDWITVNRPTEGLLQVYDLRAQSVSSIKVKHSPADIALDRKHHRLLVPVMLDNTLEIRPLTGLFPRH
ncbi:hypothetical protein HF324_25900 [Chitinophaga oryzae]|uniref:ATP-binding protein n=1 Tax=Chitinophaga oryzae TaxID=2725414 RepID=A0ABX6LLT9_9BACT|nr:hypothetical protein [Chitinophaga oryzae]QJB41091.1 hypothetical protein HF324_25900 [Chitinophaga oryzae]